MPHLGRCAGVFQFLCQRNCHSFSLAANSAWPSKKTRLIAPGNALFLYLLDGTLAPPAENLWRAKVMRAMPAFSPALPVARLEAGRSRSCGQASTHIESEKIGLSLVCRTSESIRNASVSYTHLRAHETKANGESRMPSSA